MDKLIRENIERIKSLMIESDDKSGYNFCERFAGNKQKMLLCKKIGTLKSNLHKDEGIGLKKIINKKIYELGTEIPKDLQTKFIEGSELLQSLGKISEAEKNNFIDKRVKGGRLVYLNGDWQPINKLNTNYYDLAELLTDLIYKGGDRSKDIIREIINDPNGALTKIKPYLEKLLAKYFKDVGELLNYTKNIQRTSAIGESAEQRVKEHLQNKKFKVEYEGGNGDLIDMVFGTDLIMSHPDFGTKTIQIKASEKAYDQDYKYVDWIIIATPFTIYDNKTKEKIQL